VIYFTKGNFFGNLLHPFELKCRKFITEPPYPYNMCGIDLYSMYLTWLPIQVLKTSLVYRVKKFVEIKLVLVNWLSIIEKSVKGSFKGVDGV